MSTEFPVCSTNFCNVSQPSLMIRLPDFGDFSNFDRLREILDSAERLSRITNQFDWPRISKTWEEAAKNSALLQAQNLTGQTESLLKKYAESFGGLRQSQLDELTRSQTVIRDFVERSRLGDLSSVTAQLDRIASFPQFAAITTELDAIRPILERYETQIASAPDEDAAALSLREGLKATVEAVVGFDLNTRTPAERLKLYFSVIALVVSLLLNYAQSRTIENNSRAIEDLRAGRESQRQTIIALGDTIRELQEKTIGTSDLPTVKFTARSTLRLLPSGKSQRVGTFERGSEALVLINSGRWLFVEVIKNGKRTRQLGWIYRRNVRLQPVEHD